MKEILGIATARSMGAPQAVLDKARASNRKVLHIVWDQADGYPAHGWGYQQWSVRPFQQGDGCDGTIDENVHFIAFQFCQQLGIDYAAALDRAYGWQKEREQAGEWVRHMSPQDWEALAAQTVLPPLSQKTLRRLLDDLGDINNSSLIEVLEREFTTRGFNVENWWEPA